MIDFHSHILPGIDDGSRDVAESLKLLKLLEAQGVDTVAATSHYYVTRRSPSEFFQRRAAAWEKLQAAYTGPLQIRLGAEVLYFSGISRMAELPRFKLEGTPLLLLEMPFETWSSYAVREVIEMSHSAEYTLLLAHIERYYDQQKPAVWDQLLENDILMQSNADFFLPLRTRRKALRLLGEGRIHLLGSDCHNVTGRPPRMAEAAERIRRRFGDEMLSEIDALGRELLGER